MHACVVVHVKRFTISSFLSLVPCSSLCFCLFLPVIKPPPSLVNTRIGGTTPKQGLRHKQEGAEMTTTTLVLRQKSCEMSTYTQHTSVSAGCLFNRKERKPRKEKIKGFNINNSTSRRKGEGKKQEKNLSGCYKPFSYYLFPKAK